VRIKDLWKPREKFLILDIAPERTKGLLLSVDEDKNIAPEKHWDDFSFKGTQSHSVQNLRKRKLIVSADSSLATTISFPVELKRDLGMARHPITIAELEALLAQVISKEFASRRREASVRLGLHELDTILVNAKAENFKVDRHAIMNPVGFSGKTIEVVLELAFTTRAIFENLKNFFNAKDGFFFTETARAGLRALSKFEALPVNLVFLKPHGASGFMLEKAAWGTSVHREQLDWSLNSIFESIKTAFPVPHDVVLRIYHAFLNEETSEHFRHALHKVMKPTIEKFFEAVRSSKLRGRAYIHAAVPLPFKVPLREGRVVMHELPLRDVLQKSGFSFDASEWEFPDSEMFVRLAPFLEFYNDKSESEINHRLRRRLHWLIQEP
jgi:hypothetical protein